MSRQVIHSAFNADYDPTKRRRGAHRKQRSIPPIHDDISQCTFGKGRIHVTYVTDAEGQHFVDRTRVQRCSCGERKVTRESRVSID